MSKYQIELEELYPKLKFVTPYISARQKITVEYECGHRHDVNPHDLKRRGTGSKCRICLPVGKERMKTTEAFKLELLEKYPDIICISDYTGAFNEIVIESKLCQHTWKATPNYLLVSGAGSKCPICDTRIAKLTTESFQDRLNHLYDNRFTVLSEYINTNTPITLLDNTCKHTYSIYPSTIGFRSSTWSGKCPECHITTRKKTDEKFKELLLSKYPWLEILSEYTGNKDKILIKYTTCGHEHNTRADDLLNGGHGSKCGVCNNIYGATEKELLDFIKSDYKGIILQSNRTILDGKEIDIYLPEIKLGFEYNGIKWHSAKEKGVSYHKDKTDLAASKGVRLIHIFEDEWVHNKALVKSRISGLLGNNMSLYARNFTTKIISAKELGDFCNENHLRGAGAPSSVNIGLFSKDKYEELVAVMSFSTPKTKSNYEYELVRYCSLQGINVVGGASKLLKYFIKNYSPKGIISYSDKRWSQGDLYKKIGFEFSHTTPPGYKYYKRLESFSRQKFQKFKLKTLFPDLYKEELTEYEIMDLAGYLRICDCGNDAWIIK